jgi:hypothetical protein
MDGSFTLYGENLLGGTAVPRATGSGGHYVETVLGPGATQEFAITAMRIGSAPGASATQSGTRLDVRIGSWLVSFGSNESPASSITIDSDASRFVLSDLSPDASYAIRDAQNSVAARSSAAGVLTFRLPASGRRNITVQRE